MGSPGRIAILSHTQRISKWLGAGTLIVALGSVAPCLAAIPKASLVYVRGPGAEKCPEEQVVRDMIGAQLGEDPFVVEDADIVVRARLSRQMGRLRAEITLVDNNGRIRGERRLLEVNCRELVAAAAFAISMALDPELALRAPDTADALRPTAPAPPQAAPEPPSAPPVAPADSPPPTRKATLAAASSRDRLAGRVGIGVLGSAGAAPTIGGFGLTVQAGFGRGLWSVNFEGRGDVPFADHTAGGTIKSSLVLGAIIPCVHLRWFAVCGLAAAGAQIGAGSGFAGVHQAVGPFVGAGLRGSFELAVSHRFGFLISADLLWAVLKTTLTLGNNDGFSMPPVSGALHLVAVVYF